MDLYCIDGITVRIENWKYSPYLCGYGETECTWDKYGGRRSIPYLSTMVQVYRDFLEGKVPEMDKDIESMFAYFGHINSLNYPLEYWAIKLHDNWVRDHLYPMELYLDPYYDLERVPVVNEIPKFKIPVSLPDGVYIAGGLAAWMAGFTDDFTDVDYFFVKKDSLETMLRTDYRIVYEDEELFLKKYGGKHIVALSPFKTRRGKHGNLETTFKDVKHQLVLRLYRSPTEIVHGFDVDVCGVLWDGEKLWATKRALYAAHNKINWFDPARASPSYAYRLSKYMTRGIEVGLVGLNPDLILEDKVREFYSLIREGLGLRSVYANIQDMGSLFYQLTSRSYAWPIPAKEKLQNRREMYKEMVIRLLPRDPGSILILSTLYNFHTNIWRNYDYQRVEEREQSFILRTPEDIDDYLQQLEWKVQDPMGQITSTLYPTPLENISEWWSKSPLINISSEAYD